MAMPLAPGASVPAGAGDLAVAAAFAFGAESEIGGRAADADGSDEGEASGSEGEASGSEDETGAGDASDPGAGGDGTGDTPGGEFEFSDEETRRHIPGVIRDGSDSSEWSSSSDEDEIETLDMENMPKWLEDIKNGVKSDDGSGDDAAHAEPPRTKNEIAQSEVPSAPAPPAVGADEVLVQIGAIVSVVGDVVVVQSRLNTAPMDESSVLCLQTRQGMGAIEEVFGPVSAPLYALRVPTAHAESGEGPTSVDDESHEKTPPGVPSVGASSQGKLAVKVGMLVFAVENRVVLLQTKGMHTKGYDNSGQNDEEVEDDDEFSDDELEAEAKKKRKQKKRGAEGEAENPSGLVRDGGLAAAAAAAGGFGSSGPGARNGGGRGYGGRGMDRPSMTQEKNMAGYGSGPTPGGRGFQPQHPPAMQMAYMNVGAAPSLGYNSGTQSTFQPPPQHQHQAGAHMVPLNAHGQPMMGHGPGPGPGPHGAHQMMPMQMMHGHPGMMAGQHGMPGLGQVPGMMMPPGMVMMPPTGFHVPAPPPQNWPPGQPWPPPPPAQ